VALLICPGRKTDKLDSQWLAKILLFGLLRIELLNTIPGVDKDGAIGIISEIGMDMSHFPDQKHLAKWAGMSPGANETGTKKKSGRITYGNIYLRALLAQLSWAASRTKNTYLSSKYRSLVGRRGKKKAIIAVGHKILIASYFIIKDKVAFNELGENHLTNYRKDKLIAYYKKQLSMLEPNLEFDQVVVTYYPEDMLNIILSLYSDESPTDQGTINATNRAWVIHPWDKSD
jgi:transposase